MTVYHQTEMASNEHLGAYQLINAVVVTFAVVRQQLRSGHTAEQAEIWRQKATAAPRTAC